jgi:hypothetical protein
MSVKKGFVNEFVWVTFHEHPIVDYRRAPAKLFDVTSEGHGDFPSDFICNGEFDHRQYCMCLIETAFSLQVDLLASFLDYQCGQLKNSYRWLIQFDTLLNNNCNHTIIKPFQQKLNLLIQLLEDKRNQYAGYVQERQLIFKTAIVQGGDPKFDIVKVKEELGTKVSIKARKFLLLRRRMDYLQEVENNEEASFVKCVDMELLFLETTVDFQEQEIGVVGKEKEVNKIVFRGTSTELAKWIGGIKWSRNEAGELLFDESTSTYARLAHALFCKSDGQDFNEDSIRKYLTKYNEEKLNS